MEVLKAAALTKWYKNGEEELHVLEKVSFSIEEGEFVALLGASGSGKTTLLNIVGGLDVPTSGCVFINGVNLSSLTSEELAEFRCRNIGFIFQNYNLLPVFNAYENITFPAQLNGDELDEEFLHEIVDEIGIRDKLSQLPGKLSGGQQQRVAIARALFSKPKVMLADEPTGNLDAKTSEEVILLMKRMSEKYNQAVIVVTHDESVAKKADRIFRIENGRLYEEENNS